MTPEKAKDEGIMIDGKTGEIVRSKKHVIGK